MGRRVAGGVALGVVAAAGVAAVAAAALTATVIVLDQASASPEPVHGTTLPPVLEWN
jgi:hypothetical protein